MSSVSFLNWNIYQHANFSAVSEAWETLERGTFKVLGDGFEIVAQLQRALFMRMPMQVAKHCQRFMREETGLNHLL